MVAVLVVFVGGVVADGRDRRGFEGVTVGGRGIDCGEFGAVGRHRFDPVVLECARTHTIKRIIFGAMLSHCTKTKLISSIHIRHT